MKVGVSAENMVLKLGVSLVDLDPAGENSFLANGFIPSPSVLPVNRKRKMLT